VPLMKPSLCDTVGGGGWKRRRLASARSLPAWAFRKWCLACCEVLLQHIRECKGKVKAGFETIHVCCMWSGEKHGLQC
jgi:hypothetical protein